MRIKGNFQRVYSLNWSSFEVKLRTLLTKNRKTHRYEQQTQTDAKWRTLNIVRKNLEHCFERKLFPFGHSRLEIIFAVFNSHHEIICV